MNSKITVRINQSTPEERRHAIIILNNIITDLKLINKQNAKIKKGGKV